MSHVNTLYLKFFEYSQYLHNKKLQVESPQVIEDCQDSIEEFCQYLKGITMLGTKDQEDFWASFIHSTIQQAEMDFILKRYRRMLLH